MTAKTARCLAPAWACILSLMLASTGRGATLSSESSIGISAGYASNPFLQPSGAHAAESLGLLANLPATYTSDTVIFDFIPRVRFAENNGPVALLSNYQYLDTDWRWNSERNTLTINAGWHHDSTYYNEFENAALLGHDQRRLELLGSAAWQRMLTERADVQLSASWDKVNYSQKDSPSSLIDYTYAQGAAQYGYALSERWHWSLAAGYGHYQLPSNSYTSNEIFAQTTLKRQLSERWSMSVQGGYAYLNAHAEELVCCELAINPSGQLYLAYIPVTQTASRGSPNYALSFERKTERFVFDLVGSRSIEPSGFGVLATVDDLSMSISRPWTERLTLGAALQWSRLSDSLGRIYLDRHYYDGGLSANWQWTEHWTLQLQGSYTRQFLGAGVPPGSGVTLYLNLLRQFGRLRF